MTRANQADAAYAVLPAMEQRWKRVGRSMAFKARTSAEAHRWRKALRARLKTLTGYDTFRAAPLKPRVTERVTLDGYTRERVEIQTEPGVVMPFYVLRPLGKGPFVPILNPHGHGSGGKYSPAGRADIPAVAEAISHYNYDYGVQFVRQGFISFCPDARGFGERQEPTMNAKGNVMVHACHYLNQMGYPLGQTVAGMWAWDLHRLIDYIETRSDCLADRVGCAGLSGGGLQTIYAAALDDRIRAAVISGYFYGFRESLLQMHQNCSCNYVPHLYETADVGDIGALIAPRPLLIETGDQDPLNGRSGMKNVLPQVATTRRAFALLGARERLVHDVFTGGHKWHGVNAIPFMKKWLVDGARGVKGK